jgi:hypothetical protein
MMHPNQWPTETRPDALLEMTRGTGVRTGRRLRLFACGCYRLIWKRIKLAGIREAVEKAEEFADGTLSKQALAQFRYPRGNPRRDTPDWRLILSIPSLVTTKVVPGHIAWLTRCAVEPEKYEPQKDWHEFQAQADLVRDSFANPFHPVSFDASWRTSTAVAIAQQMYESRDFAAMPILADALQDAGCDNDDILNHCRDAKGFHVRGCWVVDLVLGKS